MAGHLIKSAEGVDDTLLVCDGLNTMAVYRETLPISDWYFLARLLGVSEADYERIQQDTTARKEQQRAIIQQWLSQGAASWAVLVSALRDEVVSQTSIADQIAQNHFVKVGSIGPLASVVRSKSAGQKSPKTVPTAVIPQWYGSSTSSRRTNIPCVRVMTGFAQYKHTGGTWYSLPFVTGTGGYKLQLKVDASACDSRHSISRRGKVSVSLYLMKGEDDDCLKWPFNGSVDIKLLNWAEDENHLEHTFTTMSAVGNQSFNRVTDDGVRSADEFHKPLCVSHDSLEYDPTYNKNYLDDDSLCFAITNVKVLSDYDHSNFPPWCASELSHLQYGMLPAYRVVDNFTAKSKTDEVIHTDPFYTSKGGFKTTLHVYPNGNGSGKGTHVTVGLNLMRGPNDDNLVFPMSGIFTFQILNWKENDHHHKNSVEFDKSTPEKYRQRITDSDRGPGWGYTKFVAQSELKGNNEKLYLKDDKICVKISFEPFIPTDGNLAPVWCDQTYPSADILPCTRTLANYEAYKKTSRTWYSEPFFTSEKGYKMQLRVDAYGEVSGKGTHLSAYVYLMKGEHDNYLQWPFNSKVSIRLLNWCSDSKHLEKTAVRTDSLLKYRDRVVDTERASGAFGLFHQFITHSKLQEEGDKTTRYTDNGNVCFKMSIAY